MTVSPDEGMMLLQQRMAGQQEARHAAPQPGMDGISAELAIMIRLATALEGNTAAIRGSRRKFSFAEVHPVQLAPIAAAGAVANLGAGDERWSPRQGWAWDIQSWSVTFGAGTTSATIARDQSDPSGAWNKMTLDPPAAGSTAYWHPGGHLILLPQQRFVWSSAAGGITVSGEATEVAIDCLPDYLA